VNDCRREFQSIFGVRLQQFFYNVSQLFIFFTFKEIQLILLIEQLHNLMLGLPSSFADQVVIGNLERLFVLDYLV
jgi:hypothetical protein